MPYVYSPFSGKSLGQVCYCSVSCGGNLKACPTASSPCGTPSGCTTSCTHYVVMSGSGWRAPLDVGGIGANTPVRFYGSGTIRSIRVTRTDAICSSRVIPWTLGILVDLYGFSDGTCPIGGVMYAHLNQADRIAPGLYNTGLWGLKLGSVPSACNCSCSGDPHVHIQRKGGSSHAFSCGQGLTGGSTWVFYYNTVCI